MKRTKRLGRSPGWMMALVLMAALGTGCDAGVVSTAETSTEGKSALLAEWQLVESVEMSIVNPGSAKDEQFILHVSLDTSAPVRWPEAFHILGMRTNGGVTRMEDSGLNGDTMAGDGVFSAQVDRSCIENLDTSPWMGKDIISLTLTCEIDFISPGAECEGEGICPESSSRSFLWGLIEYDVDVVTCWCFQGCDVDIELSFGKEDPAFAHPSPNPPLSL